MWWVENSIDQSSTTQTIFDVILKKVECLHHFIGRHWQKSEWKVHRCTIPRNRMRQTTMKAFTRPQCCLDVWPIEFKCVSAKSSIKRFDGFYHRFQFWIPELFRKNIHNNSTNVYILHNSIIIWLGCVVSGLKIKEIRIVWIL